MSRRRRRVREAGPVRKSIEVVVSALFGMAVVGVVLADAAGRGVARGRPAPAGAERAGQGEVAGRAPGSTADSASTAPPRHSESRRLHRLLRGSGA